MLLPPQRDIDRRTPAQMLPSRILRKSRRWNRINVRSLVVIVRPPSTIFDVTDASSSVSAPLTISRPAVLLPPNVISTVEPAQRERRRPGHLVGRVARIVFERQVFGRDRRPPSTIFEVTDASSSVSQPWSITNPAVPLPPSVMATVEPASATTRCESRNPHRRSRRRCPGLWS